MRSTSVGLAGKRWVIGKFEEIARGEFQMPVARATAPRTSRRIRIPIPMRLRIAPGSRPMLVAGERVPRERAIAPPVDCGGPLVMREIVDRPDAGDAARPQPVRLLGHRADLDFHFPLRSHVDRELGVGLDTGQARGKARVRQPRSRAAVRVPSSVRTTPRPVR